jgi:peptide/nickel transport system permease protein
MALAAHLRRALESDAVYAFKRSPSVIVAAAVTFVFLVAAFLAPWLAPHDPLNPATLNLIDAFTPPRWMTGGEPRFLLGTDDQGRDLLSAIMFGARISFTVGILSVVLAMAIGISLGLIAGYAGGAVDAVIMRGADVQLSFPAILVAMLIDGIARGVLGTRQHEEAAQLVLVVSIGLSCWVQYARTVRGSVMVERNKEYVQAARIMGLPPHLIALRHVLPNVLGPVLVIATINLAIAIVTEATLSFLGVGVPATSPSLGTLVRVGNDFLFSGEWWILAFPAAALATLVIAVNILGDWLRDVLNPKLR